MVCYFSFSVREDGGSLMELLGTKIIWFIAVTYLYISDCGGITQLFHDSFYSLCQETAADGKLLMLVLTIDMIIMTGISTSKFVGICSLAIIRNLLRIWHLFLTYF